MSDEYIGAFAMRRMDDHLGKLPGKLIFAAVGGSHAYGFPSPTSDVDVRAVHMLPLPKLLGIETYSSTFMSNQATEDAPVVELDVKSTELLTACRRITHSDGELLEALYSPLATVKNHALYSELRFAAKPFIRSKHLARHYRGYAYGTWSSMEKQEPNWKSLCHAFRTVLTGLHALRAGEVELRLPVLAEMYAYPEILTVVGQKVGIHEAEALSAQTLASYRELFAKVFNELVAAIAVSCKEADSADIAAVEDVFWRYNVLQSIRVETSICNW